MGIKHPQIPLQRRGCWSKTSMVGRLNPLYRCVSKLIRSCVISHVKCYLSRVTNGRGGIERRKSMECWPLDITCLNLRIRHLKASAGIPAGFPDKKLWARSEICIFRLLCQYAHFNPYFLYDDYTIRIILLKLMLKTIFSTTVIHQRQYLE